MQFFSIQRNGVMGRVECKSFKEAERMQDGSPSTSSCSKQANSYFAHR